jgi:parallel beta-helix repeat protein
MALTPLRCVHAEWLRRFSVPPQRPGRSCPGLLVPQANGCSARIADLEEAIANARENDRILLGPGTWQGTFVINLPIDLQGAGPEETFIECPAIAGCALTLGPDAKGARISGITFRHLGFDAGDDRYSAALVRAGSATFADCHFIDASGHGLAVIEGAQVEIQRCQFRGNGWNGIAITGDASAATVNESQISENFGHGVETWMGGRLTLTGSRLEGNIGNGTHIDTTAAGVRIESCEIVANREFGIVLTSAHDGHLTKNRIRQNQLGGIAIRKAAAGVRADSNDVSSNAGPGLLLDQGLTAAAYQDNNVQRNGGSQILTQADLTPAPAE